MKKLLLMPKDTRLFASHSMFDVMTGRKIPVHAMKEIPVNHSIQKGPQIRRSAFSS
jgi:hypothetical protein